MIIPIPYQNRTVGVFGLGQSGLSSVRALDAAGAMVYHWDDKKAAPDDLPGTNSPIDAWPVEQMAAIVVAPGVPLTHPQPHAVVTRAHGAQVPVIGDVELFAVSGVLDGCQLVGITGTNGKSTATALLSHVLSQAGCHVGMAGNIGIPILQIDPLASGGTYVLELSSYQIDLIHSMHADIAILLNISPDHLDRHGDMAGYAAAKQRLFNLQKDSATAIISIDDPYSRAIADACDQKVVRISVETEIDNDGVMVTPAGLLVDVMTPEGAPLAMDLTRFEHLPGKHNWQNMAACYAAARLLDLSPDTIADGFASYRALPHRLEFIGEKDGVRFVNDSKATNVTATLKALGAFDRIHLICGGKAKDEDYQVLTEAAGHLAGVYTIGEAGVMLQQLFASLVPSQFCGTLDLAMAQANRAAREGDVVLLSPACASFDQFTNFEDRGDQFRILATGMIAGDEA